MSWRKWSWAAPIVPVLEPDGCVRVCGDYKVTINPVLDVPEHPMPTAESVHRVNSTGKVYKVGLVLGVPASAFR